tara:strand:+ start:211 stop:972 length:762 start_codon:yes stop_codon:yes gene_type:complete
MALIASELIVYGSAVMAQANATTPQGGAIDETTRVVFVDMSQASALNFVSSVSGDMNAVTVVGRNAGGTQITESVTLSGVVPVTGTGVYERLLSLAIPGNSGDILVMVDADSTVITTVESGVDNIIRPFMTVTGESSAGNSGIYYEKIFVKNTNSVTNLLTATISQSGDGTEAFGADIGFDTENVHDGAGTSTNRITAPTGVYGVAFNDAAKSLPSGDLDANTAVGIWLQLTVPPATSGYNTTYSLNISGSQA